MFSQRALHAFQSWVKGALTNKRLCVWRPPAPFQTLSPTSSPWGGCPLVWGLGRCLKQNIALVSCLQIPSTMSVKSGGRPLHRAQTSFSTGKTILERSHRHVGSMAMCFQQELISYQAPAHPPTQVSSPPLAVTAASASGRAHPLASTGGSTWVSDQYMCGQCSCTFSQSYHLCSTAGSSHLPALSVAVLLPTHQRCWSTTGHTRGERP